MEKSKGSATEFAEEVVEQRIDETLASVKAVRARLFRAKTIRSRSKRRRKR